MRIEMTCCAVRLYLTGILLSLERYHGTRMHALGQEADISTKVAVIHGFRNDIRRIVNATSAVSDQDDQSFDVEEIVHDEYADMTGSKLFNVGLDIRKRNDIKAVIGPSSSAGVLLLHPHLILAGIPHLSPAAEDPVFEATDRYPWLIRMTGAYNNELKAILDLLRIMEWNTLAIASSESDYTRHASEDLRQLGETVGVEISISQRLNDLTGEIAFQKHLNDIRRSGSRVILLLCDHILAGDILTEAHKVNMTSAGWAWILWNEVADELIAWNATNGPQARNNSDANVESNGFPDIPGLLAIRTSLTGGPLLHRFVAEFERLHGRNESVKLNINQLKYADAILATMYASSRCGGNVTGSSIFNCILALKGRPGITRNITFDAEKQQAVYDVQYEIFNSKAGGKWISVGTWNAGDSSRNSSMELNKDKLLLPGGVRSIPSYLTQLEYQDLEIITIASEPFVNIKQQRSSTKSTRGHVIGEDGKIYSGFCIELLKELKRSLRFKYNIRDLGSGAKFGTRNPVSGYWNGLIGELMYGNADLIIAPLTITEERLKYIDLTSSFMESELKFAINRHAVIGDDSAYYKYSFLLPFSAGLWLALLISIILMGLYLTLISRLSPYGAHGQYYQSAEGAESCAKLARRRKSTHIMAMERRKSSFAVLPSGEHSTESAKSEDGEEIQRDDDNLDSTPTKVLRSIMKKSSELKQHEDSQARFTPSGISTESDDSDSDEEGRNARRFMSINNSLYFACAGLLWQSPECVPRAPAARVVAGIWYMVGVIIVASYTANLVAFVTQRSTSNHLDSLESLINQRIISPGTVPSSSVEDLLMTSNLDMVEKLYQAMLQNPELSFQNTFSSAWDLTMKGELALVWDGVYLDYNSMRHDCKTNTIPIGFGKPSYGFALRRGSPFTGDFNRELLELKQSGFIQELTEKYFGKTCESMGLDESSEGNTQDRLTLSSLSGVFIMIGGGAAASLIVVIIEWVVSCSTEQGNLEVIEQSGFLHAFSIKFKRLSQDVRENWIPFKRTIRRWSTPVSNTDINN